jgi:LPXTG-motif cell wall-anchored protein
VNRKTAISMASVLLVAPVYFASPASAETCVPTEDVIESVLVTPAVEALFEVKLHTWTGGPTETAPPVDSPDWNPTSGDPQGGPHAEAEVGVAYNVSNGESGKGSWFLKLNVLVAPGIPAVYEDRLIPGTDCPIEEEPEVPVDLPEECPAVIDPANENIGAISSDCPVTLPKPEEPETTVGDGGVFRPAKPRPVDELPHTGTEDTVLIALAGLGLVGLGYIAYTFGRRP